MEVERQECDREAPTVADSPLPARTPQSPAFGSPHPIADAPTRLRTERAPPDDSAASSPLAALASNEATRFRLFCYLVIVFGLLGLVTPPLTGGHPVAKALFAVSVAGFVCLFVIALRITRGRRPSVRLKAILGAYSGLAALAVVHHWGIHSAAQMIVVLGLYLLAGSVSLRPGLVIWGLLSLGEGVLAFITHAGIVPDMAINPASEASTAELTIAIIFEQGMLAIAFLLARYNRQSTLEQMTELDRAVRSIAVRDALLREAQHDLKRVEGGPGLFTGQTVGSFYLEDVIGRGGMGEVYEARHVDSGEPAAVKLLQRSHLGSPAQVARFFREAAVVASLDPRHVVRVFEVASPADPIPYLAMERLHGHDLSHLLRERKQLSPSDCLNMLNQVSVGLQAAHEAGVIHRDLKPQNIFASEQGGRGTVWKILDFGVSKLVGQGGTLTQGAIVGTPGYMAPEQATGREVDHRADVFSLAAITYRALTARPPFPAPKDIAALAAALVQLPPPPSELAPVPTAVDAVLAIGLARYPEDRFDRATDLVDAFREALLRDSVPPELAQRADYLLRHRPWESDSQ